MVHSKQFIKIIGFAIEWRRTSWSARTSWSGDVHFLLKEISCHLVISSE